MDTVGSSPTPTTFHSVRLELLPYMTDEIRGSTPDPGIFDARVAYGKRVKHFNCLFLENLLNALLSQLVEEIDSKPMCSGFESQGGYFYNGDR